MPFLKFFSVYPLDSSAMPEHAGLAVVPAWGTGTVVATRNDEFKVGVVCGEFGQRRPFAATLALAVLLPSSCAHTR